MTDLTQALGSFGRRVAAGDFDTLGWSFRLLLGPTPNPDERGSFYFCGPVEPDFSVDGLGPGSVVCFVTPIGADHFSYDFVRVTRFSWYGDDGFRGVGLSVAREMIAFSETSIYVVECDSALSELVLAGLCPFVVLDYLSVDVC